MLLGRVKLDPRPFQSTTSSFYIIQMVDVKREYQIRIYIPKTHLSFMLENWFWIQNWFKTNFMYYIGSIECTNSIKERKKTMVNINVLIGSIECSKCNNERPIDSFTHNKFVEMRASYLFLTRAWSFSLSHTNNRSKCWAAKHVHWQVTYTESIITTNSVYC